MNETALYARIGGMVNHLVLSMGENSMYYQQKAAAAYRAEHPSACVRPGLFIVRLNANVLHIVRQPSSPFSCRGDGLMALIRAAMEIVGHVRADIPVYTKGEGPELRLAVDRIHDFATGYLAATTAGKERESAMGCAKALDMFGNLLITIYGNAADITNTQLRILRTWMLANLVHPPAHRTSPYGSDPEANSVPQVPATPHA